MKWYVVRLWSVKGTYTQYQVKAKYPHHAVREILDHCEKDRKRTVYRIVVLQRI